MGVLERPYCQLEIRHAMALKKPIVLLHGNLRAALLMHAGIATSSALASCTPERLVRQTGRLERSLGSGRRAVVDLTVAQHWIRRARQLTN